jgi:hypothetical protein
MATVRVAKHRLFVFLDGDILADGQLVVFARDDSYTFGCCTPALTNSGRGQWVHSCGKQKAVSVIHRLLPSRPSPSPGPTVEQWEAITQAAVELCQLRDNWLIPPDVPEADLKQRTLTNLYNRHLTWLAQAHEKLDRAVLAAYGWPHDIDDDTLLAKLLALNLERALV